MEHASKPAGMRITVLNYQTVQMQVPVQKVITSLSESLVRIITIVSTMGLRVSVARIRKIIIPQVAIALEMPVTVNRTLIVLGQ